MKRVFLSIAIITISITMVNAQSGTSFGIKGGITASNLKFSGSGVNVTFDSKIGFYGGVFAEIGVSDNFAVQPELLYSLLGAKSQGETLNLSYVSVPVLAKYLKDGLSIVAGPQISILVSAQDKSGGGDIKDQFKSTEIAGVIGAGYTTLSGFGFDARYQLGLSDIAKDTEGDGKIKSNAFMFGIHYKFKH